VWPDVLTGTPCLLPTNAGFRRSDAGVPEYFLPPGKVLAAPAELHILSRMKLDTDADTRNLEVLITGAAQGDHACFA